MQGIELQGMYDAGGGFAGLSYTYTDTNLPSQLNGAGAHSYLPEHISGRHGRIALLRPEADGGYARFVFFRELRGRSQRGPPGFASYAGPFMPGYTLVDLFTSYKFDNGWSSETSRTSSM